MPTLVDLSSAPDPRDQLHRIVQQLTGGANVGLPTETSYIATRLARGTAGLDRLVTAGGETSEPLTLVMASRESVLDYVAPVSGPAERLLRRCWPGPVEMALDVDPESGLLGRLDTEIREAVVRDGVAVSGCRPIHGCGRSCGCCPLPWWHEPAAARHWPGRGRT